MQITASQSPLTLGTQLTQITKDATIIDLPNTPSLTETTSPATQVTFSGLKNTSELYEQPKFVDVVQISNTQNKSEVTNKIGQTLAADAANLRKSKSPFTPSSFFSQLGTLSRETTHYKNAAFSYQLASAQANDKLKPTFADTGGKAQETVTLRVRTKDGDTIDINIQHSKSATGDNLEFTFDVTGKLSEAEQDALEKLANKLGQVADDFFRTGTTELHGLKEFDQANLKDFHIEFSKPKADSYSTMSYDFSVDDQTQTQHLNAKDSDGYSLDITANLRDLLSALNPSANQSLENYLTIIRKSFNEYQPLQAENSNTSSMSFIIDGLTSMLAPDNTKATSPTHSPAEAALAAFDTGLPDFTASIKAPSHVYRDPKHNLVLPESMSLKLEQHTETETQKDGRLLVKQVNSFERQSQQIEGIVGSNKGDLMTGNFNYKTVHEKQETSRILNFGKQGIENLITEHTSDKEETVKNYLAFHLIDTHNDNQNDHKITQLLDDINKHRQLGKNLDRLTALTDSHAQLFF